MTWFKGDDGWHKSRKRIRTGMDLEGSAARGLYYDAATWCADELTDGWIPADVVDYLAPGYGRDVVHRLERADLWTPDTRDGEDGWQFVGWTDDQPTRAEVLSLQSKKADGGKIGNHRRWHVDKGVTDPRCPYCHTSEPVKPQTTDRSTDRHSDEHDWSEPSTDRTSDQTTDRSTDRTSDRGSESGPTPPDPSRPDPTRPKSTALPPATRSAEAEPGTALAVADVGPPPKTRRGTRLPADWVPSADARAWAVEKLPGFNTLIEHDRFRDYWTAKSGRDATKLDWDATWRNWMRTAAERSGLRPAAALPDGRNLHRKTAAHTDHLSAYGDPDV